MRPFETYLRKLLELHVLMDSGKSESAEADKLRETMDDPWYALTEREQRIIDDVSEALYGDKSTDENA